MSKISTYEVAPVPKLADKLIGTSVGGEIEDVTYNFTLQELLDVFLPVIPANNLQGVLDYGNTATQDINLIGTITTTNLEVTDTANFLNSYFVGDTHIQGGLFDSEDSIGLAGQVLTSTGEFVEWVTLPPIFTPNLQQVLEEGNTSTVGIILTAGLEATDVDTNTATINTNITIDGTITDGDASVGAAGTVLSSTVTGVKWVALPVYSATSPLLFNSATGVFSIQQANGSQSGFLSSSDWITFNGKQNAGNYITALTGEVTASGPGSATATVSNAAVINKVLTGFNPTAGTINASDSILTAFGKTQSQINALVGGVQYQGVWNASTNTPTLTSSVGVQGHYYVVNVAGNTNLNGITDWQVGDWAIFSESVWQKVDNTESVSSVNGFTGAVSLTTDNIPEGSTNLYFLNSRARLALSATSPLGYNNTTGVFSIQQASGSQNGYLSSTDWTTFNSKQDYLNGTGLVKSTAGTITYITDNSANWNTAYNDSITSAAVTGTGTKTLTLTQQDAGTITASWTDLGLTSVGVSMPSAFNVANSPLTSNGTIAITGAGNASQYVRGDGTLAVLPTGGGGGGASVSYYLNGSINQGTIGGVTYYEMNKVPVIGTGTDFSTSTDGYIASFLTDVNDPALLQIPAGNWNFETYFNASSGGGSPTFYIELYKYDGVVFTLVASNSTNPKLINDGTSVEAYFSTLAVPQTSLTLTDRLAVRIYVNTSGRTITLHTEDNNLCQVITTFTTGITAINGLTAQVQNLTTGTSGTDFNINSLGNTHTFNLPVASATNTGKLSSTDWSTFNDKQPFITAGTTLEYFRGDKTFQTLNTTVVPEGTNLYFLDSRARTAVSASAPLSYNSTTGVFGITQAGASSDGYLSSTDWNTFNNKQASGNYITSLTGEATGTGPGATAVTLNNASVTAKVLTGINITGGTVQATDTMLTAFGKLQNQINGLIGSTIYQGTWNASTNTPALASGVGVRGYYYIVSVAGNTNLDGITDWFVGDWAIFDGTAWQQVDNTDSVTSVNGFTGAVSLTTDNISEGTTNLYFLNSRARAALSFTAGSGAYNNTTGVITIPTNNNQITNGAGYITSSALTGYVPYTGATANLDMGTGSFGINAGQFLLLAKNGSDTLGLSAYQGFLNLSGNDGIYLQLNASNNLSFFGKTSGVVTSQVGYISRAGDFSGNSFIKTGGTSSQFLKADGSVDSTAYLALSGGIMSGQIVLKESSSSADFTKGLRFPNDPFGGAGDVAGLRLYASSGENMVLELYTGDNGGLDVINFATGIGGTANNDSVKINNNKIWNAGNLSSPISGTGTEGYIPKFSASGTAIENSSIYEGEGSVSINNYLFSGLPYFSYDTALAASFRITSNTNGNQVKLAFGTVSGVNNYSNIVTTIVDNSADTKGRLDFQVRNGNNSFATPLVLAHTGAATFSSNVSINGLATSANYKLGVTGAAFISGANNKGVFITDSASFASIVGLNSAISAYNAIELRASGTDYQLYLSTNGYVGINTNNPATFLHVFGPNTSARGQLSIQSNNTSNAAKATWYYNTFNSGEIGTTGSDFYALATNNLEFYAGSNNVMRIFGNSRNGTLDLRGNLVSSFTGFGGTVGAGSSWSMVINQVQFEFETSYMVDAIGFYAPGGVNIQAWATGIIHFMADGGTNGNHYANITSNGISINLSSTNAGVWTVTFINTSGSSMSNNNARIIKLNRMN
jgi:hypothetical protein